jgi:nucleotidyltransferase/DNA polymerase involved in DNA repair
MILELASRHWVDGFHGVGPVTTLKMNPLGIETGLDLLAQTLSFLQQHFGKSGPYYWIARGVDERLVRAACGRTICKPAGQTRTRNNLSSITLSR